MKTKSFAIEAMSPEEAAVKMDLLGHDFYFFTNAETLSPRSSTNVRTATSGLIDVTLASARSRQREHQGTSQPCGTVAM